VVLGQGSHFLSIGNGFSTFAERGAAVKIPIREAKDGSVLDYFFSFLFYTTFQPTNLLGASPPRSRSHFWVCGGGDASRSKISGFRKGESSVESHQNIFRFFEVFFFPPFRKAEKHSHSFGSPTFGFRALNLAADR
jgi:hypothetical protein